MGEFQKLLTDLLNTDDSVNWGWGYQALELIEQKIEEARREFPDVNMINITISRFEIAVLDWFERWFGADET